MRLFSTGCRRHRASICLLAAGALEDRARTATENHLAACATCQNYYASVKLASSPLAKWEETFSRIEVDEALQARWTKDFSAKVTAVHSPGFTVVFSLLDWGHAMFWPCRRVWAGFAAVWLAILAVDLSSRESAQTLAQNSRPSTEMVRAYLEQEGLLVEWTGRNQTPVVEPPKPLLPPPRSEQRPQMIRS